MNFMQTLQNTLSLNSASSPSYLEKQASSGSVDHFKAYLLPLSNGASGRTDLEDVLGADLRLQEVDLVLFYIFTRML